MKIALFGGSFDPIHHGHLILARDALEQFSLDRVVFIPAAVSPHKLEASPTPVRLRIEMTAAAIADEPAFALEETEARRPGPSFTIDTIEELQARWPHAQLFYLLGEDHISKLDTWHRIDDLRRLAQLVVFGRGDAPGTHPFPRLLRRIDLSATEIRERVARGASIRYLVPEAVRTIIERHQLYREPPHHL